MSDCIFCKIVAGDLPCDRVYEDEHVIAFNDMHPQAPHHILVIPKTHVAGVNDFSDEQQLLLGAIVLAAKKIAAQLGVAEDGYRLVMNCNGHGGQTVFHTHMHFLAGRQMLWPPG
ncbi:MAG: histidine triad nucleotide-binding protein [Gammaproteobacteria bacterium]|nr:histidine triad nucleotide-binding protein [Gammaproteobacteria bacterium]